jgi:hypothetical protein
MPFRVFALLRALSVTYSASASRESYESCQGNAPEAKTTETPVLREYVTSGLLTRRGIHAATTETGRRHLMRRG